MPSADAWLGALGSAGVLSLIALVGAIAVLTSRRESGQSGDKRAPVILHLFVSFGIGAMLGDAALHLIPEVFHLLEEGHDHDDHDDHDHDHELDHDHDDHDHDHTDAIVPMLLLLFGFFFYFVLEGLLHGGVDHAHHDHHSLPHFDDETTAMMGEDGKKMLQRKSMFIIIADVMHCLVDGIAVGAAFASSMSTGLATALAIASHEIPRQLGNTAVLLAYKNTPRQALVKNFFASCSSIGGAAAGLLIGDSSDDANLYLLPVVAGGFFYISCCQLIPIVLQGIEKLSQLVLHLFVICVAVSIMVGVVYLEAETE